MRPILVSIPAKLLFVAALVLAAAALVRDVIRRRRDKTVPWSSTPLYLLVGAELLLYFKADMLFPRAAAFSHPWTDVPIYAYGVMLGTSLVVGWFIAMSLAKKDGIDQQEAGTIYMWTAVWSIIGSRLLYVITNLSEFNSITQVVMATILLVGAGLILRSFVRLLAVDPGFRAERVMTMGIAVRAPLRSTQVPPSRDHRTREAFSVRNSSRSRPNVRKPRPADMRWYAVAS